MRGLKNSASSLTSSTRALIAVVVVLFVTGTAAAVLCATRGYTLYFGDAEAHLNIARRVLDSRTPGGEQFGTVWLPLPHVLLIPFVMKDTWWFSGASAAIPSVFCYVLAGSFLFLACEQLFRSTAAAVCSTAVFALNPNTLYLQTTSMTEPVFAASLSALFWATVRYREQPLWLWLLATAAASNAGSLTRYEGWFLIPFVVIYMLFAASNKWQVFVFAVLASLGPLAWIAHNAFYYSNPLEFYNGDYSAIAIYRRQLASGIARYPGDHDLVTAFKYYAVALRLSAGWPIFVVGTVGAAVALSKRFLWPIVLLALPPIFYVWSIRSSGTPLYVPDLWPNAWYNTRYALVGLPLLAFGCGCLASVFGRWVSKDSVRWNPWAAALIVAGVGLAVSWAKVPVTWQESITNSTARRQWTREASEYLAAHYVPGSGIIYSFGDLTGVLRQARIPLSDGLHEGNRPDWDAAVQRPDLFLHEGWALAFAGDKVSAALTRTGSHGPHYTMKKRIVVPGAPVIEIYQRQLSDN
jgi:hypothetical protein